MDKLLKSPWFVKIIAFLLALLLYTVVALQEDNDSTGIFPNDDSEEYSQMVEVEEEYDTDNYILEGLPNEVEVHYEGTKAAISRLKLQRNPVIRVDLTDFEAGEYSLRLELSDIPEDVTATIENRNVKVTLHKKVTKTFPVQIELLNTNDLPDGYIAEDPVFSVKQATVTGAEEVIKTISYVKGFVDVGNAKTDLIREVALKAYKDNMGEIQVPVVPGTIDVKIPISNPKKEIPISIKTEGSLPENLVLNSIDHDVKEVTVYGPREVLDTLDLISVPVDLTNITEDQELEVKLEKPEGAFNIEPGEITITIDVEEKENVETVTFDDLPIIINGLDESVVATFITPENGLLDLVVKGPKEGLAALDKSDIKALVNIQDLSEGKHTVKIEITGPDGYFYQQSISEALLTIDNQTT